MTIAEQAATKRPNFVLRGWWWALDYAYAAAIEGSSMAIAVFGVPDAQRAAPAAGM